MGLAYSTRQFGLLFHLPTIPHPILTSPIRWLTPSNLGRYQGEGPGFDWRRTQGSAVTQETILRALVGAIVYTLFVHRRYLWQSVADDEKQPDSIRQQLASSVR